MASPQISPSNDTSALPPHYDSMDVDKQQESVTSPAYGNIDEPENNLQHPANKPQKGPHWIRGDPRWISTSKYSATAPYVVLFLFFLSLAEIVVGVLWLVQTAGDLTFQGVLQPLCIPCLSFFNTVPSGHLHLFAHANPPTMALWFSGLLSALYLASSLLYTVSCTASSASPGVQSTECWRGFHGDPDHGGPRKSVWIAVVFFSWISFVGYTIHAHMAWMVRKWMAARPKDEHGIVLEEGYALDPVQKARRDQEARERWKKIVDL